MAIAAVMWDFGGVFMDSPFAAVVRVARELGVEPERYQEIIFGPYENDTDHPWHRLERGEISLETAREEIIAIGRKQGIDSDPAHFFASMARSGTPGAREAVVATARDLNRELASALVTNNITEFRDHWKRMVPMAELFDQVVDSSEVGLRKPDPRIFELALKRLGGIDPRESAFLDDYEGNVEAACRLGIHGILVTRDYEAALDQLRRLVG